MKCDSCIHKGLCKYQSNYETIYKQINDINTGLYPQMDTPFSAKLECKRFYSESVNKSFGSIKPYDPAAVIRG